MLRLAAGAGWRRTAGVPAPDPIERRPWGVARMLSSLPPKAPQQAAPAPPLQSSLLCGFDFVVAPLAHPRHRRGAGSPPPFTRSDLLLTAAQWSGQVVGRISPWIDADAAPGSALRRDSAAALEQELRWAAHLSLQACLLPAPGGPNAARILRQALILYPGMAAWLRVPPGDAGWRAWNAARFACAHSPHLGVVLELGRELPPPELLARWHGENVKCGAGGGEEGSGSGGLKGPKRGGKGIVGTR